MHHGPEFTVVLIAAVTLVVGAATRWLSSRLHFPYTIAMLLFGIAGGIGLNHLTHDGGHGALNLIQHGSHISADLIIFVFLPALIFESAYAIDVNEFRKNLGAVSLLAVPALVASTVLVAGLMVVLTGGSWGWGWSSALVFGALISATDPVAVVAIFRELGVSKRLGVLIEGESLLNDGTSIVVFTVLVGLLTGRTEAFSTGDALVGFVKVVAGGVAVGLVLSFILSHWIERLFNDPLAEITLTLVLAYSAMIIAEGMLHVSGVMAVVVSGLWMSAQGKTKISPEVSHFLHRFWETLGYIANTLIFFLVGLVIATQAEEATASEFALIGVAYVGVMAIRFVLTYLFQPLANRVSEGVSSKDSAVISWGGLRGAVSLALALIVSQNPDIDPELRRQVLLTTAGVVLLTILVNGTTIGKLLARFGYDKPPLGEQLARLSARAAVLDGVQADVDELSHSRDLRTVQWSEVKQRLEKRRRDVAQRIESVQQALANAPDSERIAGYWSRALSVERQAYWEAYAQGTLGPIAVRVLNREIDRQLDRLARGTLEPPTSRVPSEAAHGLFRFFKSPNEGFLQMARVYDLSRAESTGAAQVLEWLNGVQDVDEAVRDKLRATYERYLTAGKERIEDMRTNLPEMATAVESRLARRIELNLEREGFENLVQGGVLEESAVEQELHEVEAEMHRLLRHRPKVPIPETADLVAATPLFQDFDEDGLKELADITEEMVLPPGEVLFREDDSGDSLFVIARGAVKVLVYVEGKEVLADVLGGGDIIGEISLLTGAPRTATIVAATSVTLGKINRQGFNQLMDKHPRLKTQVWAAFRRRNFDNYLRRKPEFSYLDQKARLAWIDRGAELELAKLGETVELDYEVDYLFVLTGAVKIGSHAYRAPALIDIDEDRSLECVVPGRVVALDTPHKREQGEAAE